MYAGKPKDDNYEVVETGGITVYVGKEYPVSPDGLTIKLKGVGYFKQLAVEGFVA